MVNCSKAFPELVIDLHLEQMFNIRSNNVTYVMKL